MTTPRKLSPRALPALLLAGVLATLAGCGVAQSAPSGAMGGVSADMHGKHAMQGRYDPARMQARMAQRMAELKTKLQITPAQEAAWTSFTTAMQPTPRTGGMDSQTSHEEMSKLPTPERLDRMRALHTQHMNEMNSRMSQRADATKAFYNVLSPEQQKTFDAEFTRAMNQRHGHMMGGKEGAERGMGRHSDQRS